MQEKLEALIERANSWNGYEREAAIKSLLLRQDPKAIRTLIKRVNDWVEPVQKLAQITLIKTLERHPGSFINHLPQIFNLRNKGRWDHRAFITTISESAAKSAPKELVAAIKDTNSKLASIALALCVTYQLAPVKELIGLGIANQQLNNSRYLASLIYQLTDSDFLETSDSLLQVSYLPLRHSVIKRLNELASEKISPMAKSLMTSKDDQIRKIARTHLAMSDADASNYYLAIIDSVCSTLNEQVIAIAEVTALQKQAAVPTLKSLLNDSAPKIRRCVLQQLAYLQGEQAKAVLATALLDPQASVVREAARLCHKNSVLFSQEEILSLAINIDRENTIDSLLLISKLQERWTRLTTYLRLLIAHQKEPATILHLRRAIDGWWRAVMHGSGAIPQSRLAELKALIELNEKTLTKYQYENLHFMMSTNS